MKERFRGVGLALLIVLTPAAAGAAETLKPDPGIKTAAPSAMLLLPLFEVDTTRGDGTTTLFAVRNERDAPVDVVISYYRTNAPQAPQIPSQELTLASKQIHTVNLRFVPNLDTDEEGVARGYVVVEATSENASIQGDYFRVTPGEDFATGFRMVNVDPQSPDNDLCNLFTLRFLNGGGFDSGTTLIFWLQADQAPDVSQPVLAYSAYDEPGHLLLANSLFSDVVAFERTAAQLLAPVSTEDFGALEIQFTDARLGFVAAVMSAEGRYSVGFEAACGDP